MKKVLVFGWVLMFGSLVSAADFYVPSPLYPTIQDGINAAATGDTVWVADGTYIEAVYVNKGIALVGVGTPTITAFGLGNTNTVTFIGIATNNASIFGFRITWGNRD